MTSMASPPAGLAHGGLHRSWYGSRISVADQGNLGVAGSRLTSGMVGATLLGSGGGTTWVMDAIGG
jgi:hypothetical protein